MATPSADRRKRISWIAGCSFLVLAFVASLALFKGQDEAPLSNPLDSQPQEHQPGLMMSEDRGEPSAQKLAPSLSNKPSGGAKNEPIPKPDHSPIDSILKDRASSFEDKATDLLECARQEDLPMEVRLSALDHAHNLDRWQTMTLCMEKPLPSPIAERLLSGVHNLNESPKDQVSACLHLMRHEDEEIRERAQRLVAFLVSAEGLASDPDKLREKADAFLNQQDGGDEEVSGQ
jgi:hypothetical protein